jgi:hypothetical protein
MRAEDLIALVERHPDGITAKRVAELSGAPNIGSVLCRLYYYGKIERRRVGPGRSELLWLPKAKMP